MRILRYGCSSGSKYPYDIDDMIQRKDRTNGRNWVMEVEPNLSFTAESSSCAVG